MTSATRSAAGADAASSMQAATRKRVIMRPAERAELQPVGLWCQGPAGTAAESAGLIHFPSWLASGRKVEATSCRFRGISGCRFDKLKALSLPKGNPLLPGEALARKNRPCRKH